MIEPLGILETVIYSDDLAAAKHFYEEVLTLPLAWYEPNRHLMFRVGPSMLLIFNPNDSQSKEIMVAGAMIPQHGCQGRSHFAFEVREDQFETIKQNLTQHGISIESEIKWPAGGHSIYCRDPSGNSVEFATASLWFNESGSLKS